jgi:hypothetical protein
MRARTVTFPKTKNGERRTVPMTDSLYRMFQSLPRPLNHEAFALPPLSPDAITIGFRRLVRGSGLSNLKFHDLRQGPRGTI